MGDNTGIEWADATWNPLVGCAVLSPGCKHCYAMKLAARLEAIDLAQERREGEPGPMAHYRGLTDQTKGGAVWNGEYNLAPDALFHKPLAWQRSRKIFVNSMSDLWYDPVPLSVIDRVFAIMALSPHHEFQLLTKRARRMRQYLNDPATPGRISEAVQTLYREGMVQREGRMEPLRVLWPLPNLWLGISVENQDQAQIRIPELMASPAAIRWISAEPLLGPVNFRTIRVDGGTVDALIGARPGYHPIDWIVVGGESGPRSRPMNPQWVRDIREQCEDAGVTFFFKQWGDWLRFGETDASGNTNVRARGKRTDVWHDWENGEFSVRVGKRDAGNFIDEKQHIAWPS